MKTDWTASEVRQGFLDFFKEREHEIVPSSPVVLPADPTLLFANAGMNQFKEYFLGARESSFRRVADTQKCIRVSGKHNDLEEVGHDTYHHTFFEMLGNWSFGDYYKKEAITWAWELLTEVWGLPKDRLWATVYRDDDEAETLWKEVTDIDPTHVLRFDEKDNFWEMGETGPCGPCSEVHIDLTDDASGGKLVNAGSPEVIELWNLVFIQYNRKSDGSLEELPSKHVDTGMGFERVVAVLQGKKSNYDTDVFQPLIRRVAELSGRTYEGEDAIAMRVLSDHVRTLSFAIADGVMPSNEGRGYVLRRLLRRAVRYGRKLGLTQPFMKELFPVLEESMADIFPELRERREEIMRALQAEEDSFAQTLDRGISMFDEVVERVRAAGEKVFPGDDAFKLYDTFGFPFDLTRLMAEEQELSVDQDGFDARMEEQRARARDARKGASGAEMDQVAALVAKGLRSEFTGYDSLDEEASVLAIVTSDGLVDELTEGQQGQILLDRTPFYGESGGQIGDTGTLDADGVQFDVTDTKKPADGLLLHVGTLTKGRISKGDALKAHVQGERRENLERHHTATHLLNYALREKVSSSIRQAGSYVAPDRLRFDFNHYEALSEEQLAAIEELVNQCIMANSEVQTREMALKDVQNSDIIAVFDEKYGDVVRVLDIGGYSKELCGGTHAGRTGDLGLFRIVSESSVAAGIRRIEAVCGSVALQMARHERDMLRDLSRRFSITVDEIPERVESLVERSRKLEKELKQQAAEAALSNVDDLLKDKKEINGIPYIVKNVGECSIDNLRMMMDAVSPKLESGLIVLGCTDNGCAHIMSTTTKDLTKRKIHAGQIASMAAKRVGGGGGGPPHKGQAGAKNGARLDEALDGVPELIRQFAEAAKQRGE